LSGLERLEQGKLTFVRPVGWERDVSRIKFDEIKSQVIQSRPELIKNFPGYDGKFGRRSSSSEYFFAVRLRDDFVRISSGIRGNAAFDFLNMFRCPENFQSG
jgi:hypothetical protein